MFDWLGGVDAAVFHFLNGSLANPFFDWLMPLASDPPYGVALIAVLLAILACKGGARGRIFVAAFLLAALVGDAVVIASVKRLVARPRPFNTILDARVLVGRSDNFSMPSSHAANWFAAAFLGFVYYRRSVYWMLPAALLVGFSRIYNGVHYPSDVLAGAVLGAGYAAGVVWGLNALWQWAGPKWFNVWHQRLPSLIEPKVCEETGAMRDDGQWLRLGYVFAGVLCVARLGFLASNAMELSEDEAYQWIWSKHLAMSYYSKPPLIAYTQFLGTHLWGDNQFGVRFFSPVISLLISFLLLRFMATIAGGRAAFVLFLICCATPLLAVGSVLMTIDPISVLFWAAAMIAGWRAVQPDGQTRDWLWVGLWMGFGFLGKYTNLYQIVCWAVFFCLWPSARAHLRKPGPWLALLVVLVCMSPVIIWNAQRDWITVKHVASDGQLEKPWTQTFVHEFILLEAGVMHPFFFVGAIWAAIAFWRQGRRDPLQLYLFSMGTPLFLMFFVLSWHSRVLPNWIAPSIAPMFCLMVIYWQRRWTESAGWLRPTLGAGIGLGVAAVVLAHSPRLLEKMLHRSIPDNLDPLRRVHGWKETAEMVEAEKRKLAAEDKPVLLIGGHYGITSQVTFYDAEAKRGVPDDPEVFFYAAKTPQNQFYFWPNYLNRKGDNAIFFREADRASLRPGWLGRWWRQEGDLFLPEDNTVHPLPAEIIAQFQSVTHIGFRDVIYKGKVAQRLEFFACRGLR
jgi:membrane-associated phospholipid phosphatase